MSCSTIGSTFFDRDAFADNPDWSDCYCQFFHVDDDAVWQARTGEQNRAAAIDLIEARRMHGYLAYLDGRPVGWCHAAPRSELPRIANDPELARGDGAGVGSIVCFLISATARRQGVATALLDAACAGFRHLGFTVAEAYPSTVASATRPTIMGRSNCTCAPGSSDSAKSTTSSSSGATWEGMPDEPQRATQR